MSFALKDAERSIITAFDYFYFSYCRIVGNAFQVKLIFLLKKL